jgi:hypothetical protein
MEAIEHLRIQFTDDLRIPRLLNGTWQVSGAHGPIDRRTALQAMLAVHNVGPRTL